jgi:tetratricopeptide (TPR) repeat protein
VRKLRERLGPLDADDYLRLALGSASPAAAAVFAHKGLQGTPTVVDPEVSLLLLREVFRAHLQARRVRSAHAIARKMVALGALPEIAYADLGRACAALGWWPQAAQAYRMAARHAPARRRAMHWEAVGTALHHARRPEDALAALERAARWALTTRPLHRAHAALVRLDGGVPEEALQGVLEDLETAPCGEGYGRYIAGLLRESLGDHAQARRHLRAFVRRNRHDATRAVTLATELRRAVKALRRLRPAPPG